MGRISNLCMLYPDHVRSAYVNIPEADIELARAIADVTVREERRWWAGCRFLRCARHPRAVASARSGQLDDAKVQDVPAVIYGLAAGQAFIDDGPLRLVGLLPQPDTRQMR